MAKKPISNLTSDVVISESAPIPDIKVKPETILVSLGGYNHAAIKTAEGFTLKASGLPGDFTAAVGSVGYVLGGVVRKGFAVVGTKAEGEYLQVKIESAS
jgi:hypothetical protein